MAYERHLVAAGVLVAKSGSGSFPPAKIVLQLLDHGGGQAVKSWTFDAQAKITIGRAPTQDVDLSDPYVSRNHADLQWEMGSWKLYSRGMNGVLIENALIKEYAITDDVTIRLGPAGPTLRVRPSAQSENLLQTLECEQMPETLFQLSEETLRREVEEIAEGDFFQQLREKARQMRGRG